MPRSTLKLPKKLAIADSAVRAPARKPIRSSSKTAKGATHRRADAKEAKPAAAAADTRNPLRFPSDTAGNSRSPAGKAEAVAPARRVEPAPDPANPQPADQSRAGGSFPDSGGPAAGGRPEQRPRTYPQRGIARSTGARALPPTPTRPDRNRPAPARLQNDLPQVAAALTPPPETPASVVSAARGLSRESPRLSRLVSELAACSRREADEWIVNGWVSVDGVVVARLGARVSPKAQIRIKDAASRHPTESITILFNKACDPVGTETEVHRDNVAALIRADNHWPEDSSGYRFQATHLRGLALAGRLDADEGGMLVYTQEGSVARRLTGGDSRLEKEYHVRVEGELSPEGLEQLRHGLSLDKVKLLRAQVSWLSEQQLRFVLHESRKRQIRGMCELVGLRATDIKRVRIGSVSLGKLTAGQWRYLRADERF